MKILFALGTLKKGGAERVITNLSNYYNYHKGKNILRIK